MPHSPATEDEENLTTRQSLNIAALWRKFHFSGRVIMCSVLLGLGLLLIGGLIFAINVDDADDDSTKTGSDASIEVPTKAPSHYTGPVVMGIGGFIVVMGVIMCLFETQVCRKRTGDSSPLISERTGDSERRPSDPSAVPSTSHTHKCHKHGSKKSKCRHAKHHSKERSKEKSPSSKSPPIPVETSKNFMTSSEENFLTPPNTLQENSNIVKKDETRDADDKHSSLMKSFTSSDPSWNQSSEFLTPSSSFIQTPVSIYNSVEIKKTPDDQSSKITELSEKQSVNSEYVNPLTIEEDRIQQLLIRVKNEQKIVADSKKTSSLETSESSSSDKDFGSSSESNEIIKNKDKATKTLEKEIKSANEITSDNLHDDTVQKVVSQEQIYHPEKVHEVKQESNANEKYRKDVDNEVLTKIPEDITNAREENPLSQHANLQEESSDINLPHTASEIKHLSSSTDKDASLVNTEKKDEQIDFDSSVSSDETVVSPDNLKEISSSNEPMTEKGTLMTQKEDSRDDSKCSTSTESPTNEVSIEDSANIDNLNTETVAENTGETKEHSVVLDVNNIVEEKANNTENAPTLQSS